MDNIFLGTGATQTDSIQGSYNIIAIGTGMYEGLFGDSADATNNGYGLGAYTNAFIGFAGLIPTDRYIPYAMAFMDAGYMYAGQANIDVWETAKQTFNDLTASLYPAPAYAGAPSRSAGLGVISSDWSDDILDIFKEAWSGFSISSIVDAFTNNDTTVMGQINVQAMTAYSTVLDGGGQNDLNSSTQYDVGGNCAHQTEVTNPIYPYVANQYVCGIHGLLELAMREDMVNNSNLDMTGAITTFHLPSFSNITWNFAYNAAKDGVVSYWDNSINAEWLANLSTNQYVQDYFYPSENGLIASYVPSWMLSIDWLKLPDAINKTNYDSIDLSFDAGYVDVYFVSTLDNLADINGAVPIELVDESMLAQDASGLVATRYVYKIRAINPQQVADALAYLQGIGEGLIGLDATNAAQTPAP